MALSGSPDAPARAGQVIAALGARVTLPLRDAHYDSARVLIARAAVLPGRVWDDSSVWTTMGRTRRTLAIHGEFSGGRYRLNATADAPFPDELAESQHLIHLTKLSDDDEFAWDTDVFYALGDLRASEAGAFVRAIISGAEGRSESAVRADYGATVPNGSRLLGQLFRIDSVSTLRGQDGSTLATVGITMTPAGIEARYPNFARYMRRYAEKARMQWALSAPSGQTYLVASMRDGRLVFTARTLDGVVLPLGGGREPLPDTLVLTGGFTMEVSIFTVGFRDYRAQFVLTGRDTSVGFEVISREEPGWVLPLITERLLRSPLRRPFQGRGAYFSMSVREGTGDDDQTILGRTLHLEVQESAILRFISRLTSTAYGDFQGDAEREQLAWLREVFDALATDARLLRR